MSLTRLPFELLPLCGVLKPERSYGRKKSGVFVSCSLQLSHVSLTSLQIRMLEEQNPESGSSTWGADPPSIGRPSELCLSSHLPVSHPGWSPRYCISALRFISLQLLLYISCYGKSFLLSFRPFSRTVAL